MQIRYFYCPVCKTEMMAPKQKNAHKVKTKGKEHRKIMWCAICKEERNFIQKDQYFISNVYFR